MSGDGSAHSTPLPQRADRAIRTLLGAINDRPGLRFGAFVVGAVVFAVLTATSWARWADQGGSIDAVWLGLLLALASMLFLLLGFEFGLMARSMGTGIPGRVVFRLSALGSLMNQLPLPGVVGTRSVGLVESGATLGSSVVATVAVSGLAAAVGIGGLGVVLLGSALAVGAAVIIGALVGAGLATIVLSRHVSGSILATILGLSVVRWVVAVAIQASAFATVGAPQSLGASIVATSAASLAGVIAFLPGGLGLWEGLAAALAGVGSYPAEAGVLAAALQRVVWLMVLGLALAATSLAVRSRNR